MRQNLASLLLIGLLAACAQGQFIDLGSSTQLNGVDPVYGMFGQLETKYNGQEGMYAFWKPEKEPVQLLPYPTASLSGINAHCLAGTYTSFQNFNIAGFQQCTDKNGNVQFFEFEFGANATILTTQLHGSQTVVGYYDNFHLIDTGLIATPVFDSSGAVRSYNTTNYTVPGALSTKLLTADETQIAGSYESSPNHWSGFIQQTSGGPITVVNFPGATTTAVTALGSKCYAGNFVVGDGPQQGFVHCSGFVPLNIGYGATWITEIRDNGDVVGYFSQKGSGYRGFIWKGLAR